MSWTAIIQIIWEILKALGVVDWLNNKIKEWLTRGAEHVPALTLTASAKPADTKAAVETLFDTAREHAGPLERMGLRFAQRIVTKRSGAVHAHLVGVRKGTPIEPNELTPLNGQEKRLLSMFDES